MIDFYWLKSFTEIIQLFISFFFILFITKKFSPLSIPLKWFLGFLTFKIIGDLYGILNYTSWIVDILGKTFLSAYRVCMGTLELSMLACFITFTEYIIHNNREPEIEKRSKYYFILPVLLIPLNFYLYFIQNNSLTEVFLLVRILFIVSMVSLLISQKKENANRNFLFLCLAWNVLWFTEVFLRQTLGLITETQSWIIFVLSELCLTIGVSYYLIQVIIKPKLFRFESISMLLPSALVKSIKLKLEKAMKEDKIYKNSDLTLNTLAQHLNIPSNDLTLFLNRILGLNFNQYLSSHRIEESKRLLTDYSKNKLTIEQTMYEVGFNSKSVFNTAFKENTGLTPSAYRKTQQLSL